MQKIDQARIEEQAAQREGNLEKVAEIRYGLIRECEQKLKLKHNELQELQKTIPFSTKKLMPMILPWLSPNGREFLLHACWKAKRKNS